MALWAQLVEGCAGDSDQILASKIRHLQQSPCCTLKLVLNGCDTFESANSFKTVGGIRVQGVALRLNSRV